MIIVLVKDPTIVEHIIDALPTRGYLVLVTKEIEKAIEVYEV